VLTPNPAGQLEPIQANLKDLNQLVQLQEQILAGFTTLDEDLSALQAATQTFIASNEGNRQQNHSLFQKAVSKASESLEKLNVLQLAAQPLQGSLDSRLAQDAFKLAGFSLKSLLPANQITADAINKLKSIPATCDVACQQKLNETVNQVAKSAKDQKQAATQEQQKNLNQQKEWVKQLVQIQLVLTLPEKIRLKIKDTPNPESPNPESPPTYTLSLENFKIEGAPISGDKLTWSLVNTKVATVEKKGLQVMIRAQQTGQTKLILKLNLDAQRTVETSTDVIVDPTSLKDCAAVPANTWVVDGAIATPGDGKSWKTAFKTVQEALEKAKANQGQEIWIKGATGPGLNYSARSKPLALKAGVHLRGGFNCFETQASQAQPKTNRTILDGGFANVVLSATDLATLTEISGLTIRYGRSTAGGGGIRIDNSRVDLSDSIINNNRSDVQGGGVFITGNEEVNIDRSIFISNTATAGAAIYDETGDAPVRVRNTILRNNNAQSSVNRAGGAIAVVAKGADNGNFFVVNSVFNDNTGRRGGALAVMGQEESSRNKTSAATVRNSIFWGNQADVEGGNQMYVYGAGSVINYNHNLFQGNALPKDFLAEKFTPNGDVGKLDDKGNNTIYTGPQKNPYLNQADAPNGPDGIPGTADDQLRLYPYPEQMPPQMGSPLIFWASPEHVGILAHLNRGLVRQCLYLPSEAPTFPWPML
jgi:hypothetical protein